MLSSASARNKREEKNTFRGSRSFPMTRMHPEMPTGCAKNARARPEEYRSLI